MKTHRQFLMLALTMIAQLEAADVHGDERHPNIVYIMSDELAYYELSHMGNPRIHTPRIDQMAAEGLRFTQALAGSPVCAPLRCNLMTGKHAGHASVRANGGGTPLRADETTIATLLQERGYATGGFGKWGCGGRDSTGVPEKHGFDVFFGYYDQVHAHSYYPAYLIRNSEEVVLPGNVGGRTGQTYSHYVIMEEALMFLREHQSGPFFCYLPITPPHGLFDIPQDDPAWDQYRGDDWVEDPEVSQDARNYAAMVTMVDRNVGQVLDLLAELGLEQDTIVFFTGDNGGQDRFASKAHPRGYFGPNVNPLNGVEFRGGKGSLYEGGLRIPFLVRWPGKIAEGRVSDLLCYQPDVLPTLAELAGVTPPDDIDGISVLPEILGEAAVGRPQEQHEFLYWEHGPQIAVRMDHWKAIQAKKDSPWALYDLRHDVSETTNVAEEHPEILARLQRFAEQSHEPVRSGEFLDPQRTRHEKDRRAKFGVAPAKAGPSSRRWILPQEPNLIPATQYRLVRFSSHNEGNDRQAGYAIDGDPETVWHSQFSGTLARPPHELVIDLGESREISGFRYLARQNGSWNGTFARTEFCVGESPDDFGEPVVTAVFGKMRTPQSADCAEPVRGRYVLVRALSEVNDGPWASAAEIGIVGTDSK